jgi:hypothetical protein
MSPLTPSEVEGGSKRPRNGASNLRLPAPMKDASGDLGVLLFKRLYACLVRRSRHQEGAQIAPYALSQSLKAASLFALNRLVFA